MRETSPLLALVTGFPSCPTWELRAGLRELVAELDVAELEAALRGEVEKLRTELVDEDELARVRAQVVAGKTFERDSMHYQALQIGLLETIGLDWRLADTHVERLKQVTAEQVRQVARKYLVDDHLTVAELVPLPLDSNERVSHNGGEQSHVN